MAYLLSVVKSCYNVLASAVRKRIYACLASSRSVSTIFRIGHALESACIDSLSHCPSRRSTPCVALSVDVSDRTAYLSAFYRARGYFWPFYVAQIASDALVLAWYIKVSCR